LLRRAEGLLAMTLSYYTENVNTNQQIFPMGNGTQAAIP
jgi:hypothetical protein